MLHTDTCFMSRPQHAVDAFVAVPPDFLYNNAVQINQSSPAGAACPMGCRKEETI